VNDARVLIITINFRRADCTVQFLQSVSRLEQFNTSHLAIVDNNSEDGSVPSLRQAISQFSNVELLPSSRNRGYFGAADWALRHYLEGHNAPDWVVVCNNDIVFDDLQLLSRLSEKDAMATGVIAPSIISGLTGHDANPSIERRPTELRMWRYRAWLSNYYMMWFKQWLSPFVRRVRYSVSRRKRGPGEAVSRAIYAPHGSFLIFSRRFFEAGGFIDDGSFLYGEEFSVAEMCLRLGLPVIHDPSLRVQHQEGQSAGRMLTRRIYLLQKNGFRYALSRYRNSYPELSLTGFTAKTATPADAPSLRHISSAGETIR
jgi:GT2 family glycosyltransferase